MADGNIVTDLQFPFKILVYFLLNVYVNKQSCWIWNNDNSQAMIETALDPEKVNVL